MLHSTRSSARKGERLDRARERIVQLQLLPLSSPHRIPQVKNKPKNRARVSNKTKKKQQAPSRRNSFHSGAGADDLRYEIGIEAAGRSRSRRARSEHY
jgi:hypothetical protein